MARDGAPVIVVHNIHTLRCDLDHISVLDQNALGKHVLLPVAVEILLAS